MKLILISGNLTTDPKVKTIGEKSVKVANFAIGNNDDNENPEFYEIRAWGVNAEWAEKNLKKGDRIVVTGSFKNEKYTGADNKPKTKFIITADKVFFK